MAIIEVRHIEFDDQGGELITTEKVEVADDLLAEQSQAAAVGIRIAEIKLDLAAIDQRRIRPMAEGDTECLATLNAQAVLLRAELQDLLK